MLVDKGLNDRWVKPAHVTIRGSSLEIRLDEPLGWHWSDQLVSFELPASWKGPLEVTLDDQPVLHQRSGRSLWIDVGQLHPHETRFYQVRRQRSKRPNDSVSQSDANHSVRVQERKTFVEASTGLISLRLPATSQLKAGRPVPGPILALRRDNGPWIGRGSIQTEREARSVQTRIVESGSLWTSIEVLYSFDDGSTYRVLVKLRPDREWCEIQEQSTLPVHYWPAPRPCREIGSLGTSHWGQNHADIAKPCLRPTPTCQFIFDLQPGFQPDRMCTHSTASWELMDMPLGAAGSSTGLRTYTAMRAAYVGIDGAWMSVYNSQRDELVGVASIDLAHWQEPDDTVHPAHRTPGFNAEVLLVDSKEQQQFTFPIQSIRRRWLLAVHSRAGHKGATPTRPPKGKPLRLEADPGHPLWQLRNLQGDFRLDKTKDWVLDWPDLDHAHPRVLCDRQDLSAIKRKVERTPELKACYLQTSSMRSSDRYLMTGQGGGLAEIEAATHAGAVIERIFRTGYAGPNYCIALARPLRRYLIACDIEWDSFTPEEKQLARRTIALGAYILSDGDWWQFAFRKNETTYLPNFNTDVFCCTGLAGLMLSDHPCSQVWIEGMRQRMEIELDHYMRLDGTGEENLGSYLLTTWTMLLMPAFWAMRRRNVHDYSTDPRVLAGARFILRIIGPPDPRDEGRRQFPPIGHHPQARKDLPFVAWIAAFIKKADPQLASNLMWVWRELGSPVRNLYDHSGPTANPFTRQFVFHDPSIKPRPPQLPSFDMPHVGALFRTHGLTDRGSFLILKAGRVHSHHDEDEGSFHYFARGVPLAVDGLPLTNGAGAAEHNAVTFDQPGQPSGRVVAFASTPAADYVRAVIPPRGFCIDAMYFDGNHRSGWERQLLLVKSDTPGGIEYLVVKDSVVGPNPCQWNLDVLSTKPKIRDTGHVAFPGHQQLGMALDVFLLEPDRVEITLQQGMLREDLKQKNPKEKQPWQINVWQPTEHWIMHAAAPAGSTFVAVLFPRRPDEGLPTIEYLAREETIAIDHDEGRDLIFLRPNPAVATILEDVQFRGRAGLVRTRGQQRILQPLDANEMIRVRGPQHRVRVI